MSSFDNLENVLDSFRSTTIKVKQLTGVISSALPATEEQKAVYSSTLGQLAMLKQCLGEKTNLCYEAMAHCGEMSRGEIVKACNKVYSEIVSTEKQLS